MPSPPGPLVDMATLPGSKPRTRHWFQLRPDKNEGITRQSPADAYAGLIRNDAQLLIFHSDYLLDSMSESIKISEMGQLFNFHLNHFLTIALV